MNIAARLQSAGRAGRRLHLGHACTSMCASTRRIASPTSGRQLVKNIDEPVRGYRLSPTRRAGGPTRAEPARPLPLPDKPSIAVLPFTNMSGDPEQEYFADGLVEDIITALSRVRSFFVIARNSSFTYKGRAVDVRQVVARARRPLRPRRQHPQGRLAGPHRRPADRRDHRAPCLGRPLRRRHERHLRPAGQGHGERGRRRRAEHPAGRRSGRPAPSRPSYITAYDLYLRALPGFYSMTREGFAEVRRLTNEALSIDPGFTLAKALGAYIRSISVSQCWHEPDDVRVAVRMAREVLAEARDDPTSLRFAAQVLAYSAKDYETALSAIERSLLPQPQLRPGLYGRRLGERPCRPPAGRDRAFPPGHAPEPGRPREGHRALRHRHELPDARTLRGSAGMGRERAAGDAQLRLLAPGRDRGAGRARPAGRGAGGGAAA